MIFILCEIEDYSIGKGMDCSYFLKAYFYGKNSNILLFFFVKLKIMYYVDHSYFFKAHFSHLPKGANLSKRTRGSSWCITRWSLPALVLLPLFQCLHECEWWEECDHGGLWSEVTVLTAKLAGGLRSDRCWCIKFLADFESVRRKRNLITYCPGRTSLNTCTKCIGVRVCWITSTFRFRDTSHSFFTRWSLSKWAKWLTSLKGNLWTFPVRWI